LSIKNFKQNHKKLKTLVDGAKIAIFRQKKWPDCRELLYELGDLFELRVFSRPD
jgi:hypothetical protein